MGVVLLPIGHGLNFPHEKGYVPLTVKDRVVLVLSVNSVDQAEGSAKFAVDLFGC